MSANYQNTYLRGAKARREGVPRAKCPYNARDTATVGKGRRIPTGARAYARAWLSGWDDEDKKQKEG